MPERVGIPGFLRGRRYCALEGLPEFFTLYEAESLEVLTGPHYAARLDNPTAWTRRVAPQLKNNVRSLCNVALSLGLGPGRPGHDMALRCCLLQASGAPLREACGELLTETTLAQAGALELATGLYQLQLVPTIT